MQIIKKSDNSYILRFDRGEEFIDTVQKFCEQKSIYAGWIQAIGSASDVDLAYFDTKTKDYDIKGFKEFLEIVTITGNITMKNEQPFCHVHGIFSKSNMETIGGHIHRCVISATCEVILFVGDGEIKREFDDKTGLHLLN